MFLGSRGRWRQSPTSPDPIAFNEFVEATQDVWNVERRESAYFDDFLTKLARSSTIKTAQDVVLIHSKVLLNKLLGRLS
ncbi:MAG: hypothetical protein MHPSP_003417, partial [Paramarteilia canceri]